MREHDEQIEEFNIMINKYIKEGKINHAYLLETNSEFRLVLAKELVKKILNIQEERKIDDLIRDFDLQIIQTCLQSIKKEEINELKEKFKTTSINNGKRIYIIEEAEKLNTSSANTLLKFLEEPEENIIAILITNNRNNVINTIVSRCQILRYYTGDKTFSKYEESYIEALFCFIITLEEKKEKAIAYINKCNIKELLDRAYLAEYLKNILYVYNDVLHAKLDIEINYFPSYEEKIKAIANSNDLISLKRKINAINMCIERLKYNTNVKLLLDKLIILMSGVDINV